MRVCTSPGDLHAIKQSWIEEAGRPVRVGFVSTMGALHAGHRYLLNRARRENDRVVLSVFVDPLRFFWGDGYDYCRRYEKRDLEIARQEGVDLFFVPSKEELRISPLSKRVKLEDVLGDLCGMVRLRFLAREVAIVFALCQLIRPHSLYLGRNDVHRLILIQRLVKDFRLPLNVVEMPIVRERDGLVCNSRNVYLTPEERKIVPDLHWFLWHTLVEIFKDPSRRSPSRPSWNESMNEFILDLRRELESVDLSREGSEYIEEVLRYMAWEFAEVWDKMTSSIVFVESLDLRTYPDLQVPKNLSVRPLVCSVAIRIGSMRLVDHIWITEDGVEDGILCPSSHAECGWMVSSLAERYYRTCDGV